MNANKVLKEFEETNVNCKELEGVLTDSIILAVNDTADITEKQFEAVKLGIFSSADNPNTPISFAALQIATFINSCR